MPLKPGNRYTKDDLYKIFKVPKERQKGSWNTGYLCFDNYIFIFANIGVAGRTGHDYNNRWDGNKLIWYGKTGSHINQSAIQLMLSGKVPVLIFTRKNDREAFNFQGYGTPIAIDSKEVPIKVTWQILDAEELIASEETEGTFSEDIKQAKNDVVKNKITILRRLRNGQPAFKRNLLHLSEGKCSVTDCDTVEVLDACHLNPHAKSGDNDTGNGLLLRADIHDLFDAFLLGIHPVTGKIQIKEELKNTEYYKYHGKALSRKLKTIKKDALKIRWELYLNGGKKIRKTARD